MPGVQVVAHSEVQGQVAGNLPVVLEVSAHLKIAPVADVAGQVSRLSGQNSGIDSGGLCVRAVGRKEERIEEVVRRPRHVELAVFEVPAEVDACLDAVLAVGNRNHVRVGVDVLVERLRISGVGTESHAAVIEAQIRYAWASRWSRHR